MCFHTHMSTLEHIHTCIELYAHARPHIHAHTYTPTHTRPHINAHTYKPIPCACGPATSHLPLRFRDLITSTAVTSTLVYRAPPPAHLPCPHSHSVTRCPFSLVSHSPTLCTIHTCTCASLPPLFPSSPFPPSPSFPPSLLSLPPLPPPPLLPLLPSPSFPPPPSLPLLPSLPSFPHSISSIHLLTSLTYLHPSSSLSLLPRPRRRTYPMTLWSESWCWCAVVWRSP